AGATPIAHARCTVIKVHGDYLSPDLRNTVDELAGYDPEIDGLLAEVFGQYGLIVCGWSARWDEALRSAILRAPTRYPLYFAHVGELSAEAAELVANRSGAALAIDNADLFFDEVRGKVAALEDLTDPSPASTELAVATLKRYLVDDRHRIRLHDLMLAEAA